MRKAGLAVGLAFGVFNLQTASVEPQPAGDAEARTIIQRALERAVWNKEQDWVAQYRSHMTREVRRFDGNGNITEEDRGDFSVVPVEGVPFERRLTVNGRPMSDEERGWEDDREAEFRADIRKTRAMAREVENDVNEIAFNGDLIGRYTLTLVGEDRLRRRPTYRIAFEPRSNDLPVRHRIDHALNKANGHIWIDRETHEAARVEFELTERVRLWWGVLGSIIRARGSLDRTPVLPLLDDNVWARVQFETYTDTRTIFKRTRRAEFRRWREFDWVEDRRSH